MRDIRPKFLFARFTIVAVFTSLCGFATAQNGWRMDGYNPSRTNATVVAGPNTAPSFTPIATAVDGALLRITPDGTLLTLSAPNGTFTTVSAYSSSGTFKWSQSLQAEDGFGVRDLAIDKSGEIYAATNTAVFSLSPVDGHTVWTHFESLNDRSSKLAVGQDGTIYYSNSSGVVGYTPNIVALNPDGSVKWHLQNSVADRLVLSSDESKLYLLGSRPTFGYTYGAVDPLSTIDGSLLPQSPSCDPAGDIFAFAPSNVLYAGDKSGGMTAFSPDVQTCSSLDGLQTVGGIAAIAPDGTLVLAQYSSGALAGMDESGKLLWSLSEPTLSAFADANSVVFSLPGSAAITLGQPFPIAATVAKTGQELWRANFGNQITGALLGDDGCLYLTSGATLYRGCVEGTISVTTNLATAIFTITGPATYSGSGTSFTQTNAPPGTYTITYGAVAGYLTPPSESKNLAVNGTVSFSATYQPNQLPTFTVSPGSLSFTYPQGFVGPILGQRISIDSTGAPLTFTASASTQSGGSWLSINPHVGTTPSSMLVIPALGLPFGDYKGTIVISSGGAASTATILVALTVTTSGQPSLTLAPYSTSPIAGQADAVTATLRAANGTPIADKRVLFEISGANNLTGTAKSDISGNAVFSYQGNVGTDSISASASLNGTGVVASPVIIDWLPPVPPSNVVLNIKTVPLQKKVTFSDSDLWGSVTKIVGDEFDQAIVSPQRFEGDDCYTGTLAALKKLSIKQQNSIALNFLAQEIATIGLGPLTTGTAVDDVLLKTAADLSAKSLSGGIADFGPDALVTATNETAGYVLGKAIGDFSGVFSGSLSDLIDKMVNDERMAAIAGVDSNSSGVGDPATVAMKLEYSPFTHFVVMDATATCQKPAGQISQTFVFRYEIAKAGLFNLGFQIVGNPDIFRIESDGSISH